MVTGITIRIKLTVKKRDGQRKNIKFSSISFVSP